MNNYKEKKVELQVELLQPWSTFVMKTKLPPLILEKMIKITDELITNVESIGVGGGDSEQPKFGITDHGASATFIPAEIPMVKLEILEREDVMEFFLDVARQWVICQTLQKLPMNKEETLNEEWATRMVSMWTISQRDNEFNPLHIHSHTGGLVGDNFRGVSAVMYLKIPEYLPSRNPTPNDYGAITFINNTAVDPVWSAPFMTLQPEVGDLYLFSSAQPHQVYPFKTVDGKGERRSVSYNTEFTNKTQQDILKKRSMLEKNV